jgi:uncharacterized membrane protein
MIDYQSDVVVNRPVEEVFRYLSDVSRYDHWTDMSGTHLISNGAFGLGSQIATTLQLGPSKQNLVFEVADYEENRTIGWKTTSNGNLKWDAVYSFEPQGANVTRVFSSGQISLKGLLRPLEAMMAGEIRSGEAKELVRLKELIEAG